MCLFSGRTPKWWFAFWFPCKNRAKKGVPKEDTAFCARSFRFGCLERNKVTGLSDRSSVRQDWASRRIGDLQDGATSYVCQRAIGAIHRPLACCPHSLSSWTLVAFWVWATLVANTGTKFGYYFLEPIHSGSECQFRVDKYLLSTHTAAACGGFTCVLTCCGMCAECGKSIEESRVVVFGLDFRRIMPCRSSFWSLDWLSFFGSCAARQALRTHADSMTYMPSCTRPLTRQSRGNSAAPKSASHSACFWAGGSTWSYAGSRQASTSGFGCCSSGHRYIVVAGMQESPCWGQNS